MKINNAAGNESVIKNGYIQNRMEGGAKAGEAVKVENGSINASGLGIFEDDIANKKQKVMKEAMDFVKKQFEADGEIDKTIESCRARSSESRERLKEAQSELNSLEEEKQQRLAMCEEGSEEYKAIEEEYEGKRSATGKLEQAGLKAGWEEQKESAKKDIALQAGSIRGIKQEVLKHHGIIDAEKARELTLESAGKEITGMLVDEAKEKIEEDIKDAVEKGEEQKEQKEEIEGKLEEIQAEQKKKAKDLDEDAEEKHNNKKGTTVAINDDWNEQYKKVMENIEKITAEQKILLEEIKGIEVDTIL